MLIIDDEGDSDGPRHLPQVGPMHLLLDMSAYEQSCRLPAGTPVVRRGPRTIPGVVYVVVCGHVPESEPSCALACDDGHEARPRWHDEMARIDTERLPTCTEAENQIGERQL